MIYVISYLFNKWLEKGLSSRKVYSLNNEIIKTEIFFIVQIVCLNKSANHTLKNLCRDCTEVKSLNLQLNVNNCKAFIENWRLCYHRVREVWRCFKMNHIWHWLLKQTPTYIYVLRGRCQQSDWTCLGSDCTVF